MIPIPEKYLGFDIETSEQAQDGKISPITVASTVTSDGEERAWFSDAEDPSFCGIVGKGKDETWDVSGRKPAQLMTKATAQAMLGYMAEKQAQGYAIVAWNGASFDLKMLGHLADKVELAGRLAMGMLDPMYQILSQKGFAIGLKAAGEGLGIGQTKTMEGKDAPEAWKKGEFQKVIGYVIGDSQMGNKIFAAIANAEGIRWTTKAGKQSYVQFRKFKTVAECLLDPPVDQSWQKSSKPLDKNQMVAWVPVESRGKAKKDAEAADTKARKGADAGARPLLLIVSGPSGAGKTVLRDELLRTMPEIRKSTTVTTRAPRKGEVNGVDYVFVSPDKFKEMADKGEFLEWAEVHGNKYGSSKSDVSTRLAKGQDVILIVDVQGARSIREFYWTLKQDVRDKFCFADVFIMPPSLDELKKRLMARGKDDEATIDRRVANAKEEIARVAEYKYSILNDTMDKAWDRLRSIVVAERCLTAGQLPF